MRRPPRCISRRGAGAARPALTPPAAAARRSKKIGKYNIQMCTTTPCMVMGAYDVLDTIKETLDCKIGGDKDSDGCYIAAGMKLCAKTGKCAHPWEC